MPKLTDESLMPTGKWKDTKMANIPASYLLWLRNNDRATIWVAKYIRENLKTLQAEVEYEDKQNCREE